MLSYTNCLIFSIVSDVDFCLLVDFLKIMPFDETLMDLSLSHCYDWNYRRPLYIGHRGMGMSLTLDKFNKQSDIPENSIHSFLSAVDHVSQ